MSDENPFVAVGAGERAPWADEPLTCPECGEGPLPLKDSDPPGLTFISHCGQSWLRGQPDFDALFDVPASAPMDAAGDSRKGRRDG